MENKKFISIAELAKLLGISRIAVYKKIKSGKIKAQKVGRNFIIDKKEVSKIITKELTPAEKIEIEKAVKKTVNEYGEALKLLGRTWLEAYL